MEVASWSQCHEPFICQCCRFRESDSRSHRWCDNLRLSAFRALPQAGLFCQQDRSCAVIKRCIHNRVCYRLCCTLMFPVAHTLLVGRERGRGRVKTQTIKRQKRILFIDKQCNLITFRWYLCFKGVQHVFTQGLRKRQRHVWGTFRSRPLSSSSSSSCLLPSKTNYYLITVIFLRFSSRPLPSKLLIWRLVRGDSRKHRHMTLDRNVWSVRVKKKVDKINKTVGRGLGFHVIKRALTENEDAIFEKDPVAPNHFLCSLVLLTPPRSLTINLIIDFYYCGKLVHLQLLDFDRTIFMTKIQ